MAIATEWADLEATVYARGRLFALLPVIVVTGSV